MATTGFAAIRSALANDNYRYYATSNILSHFGTWIQRVGMGWLAWELTESPFWLGVIGFADMVPAVVLAPFAGAIADRVNRLRGIQFTQSLALIQSIILAALAFTGDATIEWLVALALFRGVIMAFNQPMRFSLLPSLIERKDLPSAIAINSMSFNLARFLGPMLSAGIIALWGVAVAFALNALSFFIFIIALYAIKLVIPPRDNKKPLGNIPREILEGVQYCLHTRGVAQVFVILAGVAIFGRAFTELLPGFADGVFNRGVEGLGYLHSAMGCGAILGSVFLARRGTIIGMARLVAIYTAVIGVSLILFATTSNFWFALGSVFVCGFAMVVVGVGEQQLIQNTISGDVRGRVMSLYGMMSRGGTAAGALIMGVIGEALGIQWPVVIGGALMLVLCLWVFSRRKFLADALERDSSEERFSGKPGFQ